MFDVNIEFDDITVSSIEKIDVEDIGNWYNREGQYSVEKEKILEFKELYQIFLEYYVSENEFFLKLENKKGIIGIFKGRVEFKLKNKVLISCFMLKHNFKGKDLQNKIIKNIIYHFSENYGIYEFSTIIDASNKELLRLWSVNGFKLTRIFNNFYRNIDESSKLMILEKEQFSKL